MAKPTFTSPPGILAFTDQLFKAKSVNGSKEKFGVSILFDGKAQASPAFQDLEKAVELEIKERWGAKASSMKIKSPFLDGDDFPHLKGFAGKKFLRLSSEYPPGFVQRNGEEFGPGEAKEEIYSGCTARVTMNLFSYDTQGNRGISFGLRNVQKLGDGEKIGGRGNPAGDFGAVEEDDANLDAEFAKRFG